MKVLFIIVSAVYVLCMFTYGNSDSLDSLTKILNEITSSNNYKKSEIHMEDGALIVNNTKTAKGKKFYNWFFTNWNTTELHAGYFLAIQENVVSRQRSLISITIDEYVISTFSLHTNDNDFERIGAEQIEKVRLYLRHPDSKYNLLIQD